MSTVRFRFDIRDTVVVLPLNITGVVYARCDRGNGIHDYRVVFWYDGQRRDDWLYDIELGKAKT